MYSVFRNLAIIMLSAKFFGLVARKLKAPQVVGEIIAGLLIGPCLLGLVHTSDTIEIFAEIGVVLLMFTTGLGTNLKELMRAGPIATLIACVGVAVPLAGGTLLYSLFYGFSAVGSPEFYRALFIGTIMTATSVSITVATLQELGHLKSFLGTTIGGHRRCHRHRSTDLCAGGQLRHWYRSGQGPAGYRPLLPCGHCHWRGGA